MKSRADHRTRLRMQLVSTRIRADEGAVAASEDMITNEVDVGVFVAQDRCLRFVNRRFAELTGREADELANVPLAELVVASDRPALIEALEKIERTGEGLVIVRLGRKHAEPLEADIRIWGGSLDGGSTIVGFVRDLAALREAERQQVTLHERIEQAAQEWRLTFDAVETPIVILDADGTVRRINRAARMVAGKSYEEIIHHPAERLGAEEPWALIRELAGNLFGDGSPATGQVRTEDERTWDVLVIPFHLPGADQARALAAAWDVTQVVELQAALDHTKTMAEIGGVVAGVAHEVRNPLFAISATLDALEQESGGQYPEYFKVLHEEIDRMVKLMQQLLDYGRPSRSEFTYDEPIERVVNRAIGACSQAAAANDVTVEKVMESDQPSLFFDPDRLARAVENVIHNAIVHSPEGGRVVVRMLRSDDRHQSWFLIRVEDQGSGFSEDHISRVFEPFFTRRKGGTGLGLSMVRQIVEEHGGKVAAENRPEGGGAIVLRLPLQQSGAEPGVVS